MYNVNNAEDIIKQIYTSSQPARPEEAVCTRDRAWPNKHASSMSAGTKLVRSGIFKTLHTQTNKKEEGKTLSLILTFTYVVYWTGRALSRTDTWVAHAYLPSNPIRHDYIPIAGLIVLSMII